MSRLQHFIIFLTNFGLLWLFLHKINPSRNSPLIGPRSTKQQRWVPSSIQLRDVTLDDNEIIFRKTRSILNKLTPEKFDKLCHDILNIGIDSKVILKGIVILIFEKAIDELRYSSLYANLCRRLYHEAPNFDPVQQVGSSGPKPNTFRRLLITKLQDEFENRNKKLEAFDSKDGILTEEEEEQRAKAKQHMLGNIKFIGELCRLNILHESILHKCIKQLINKKKKGTIDDLAEDLECLCQIMTTCGRRLDHEKAKSLMDQYFERMEYLQRKKAELPPRIRFMLQDVIDLREAKWIPRNVKVNQDPKTLGQIRTELSEHYPSLLFDVKPMKEKNVANSHMHFGNQYHTANNSAGLGFFPMTKKQQYSGFNAPLSPPLVTSKGAEPNSPGTGFDFFSTPPQSCPAQPAAVNNGSAISNQPTMYPSFTPPYMNGGSDASMQYAPPINRQYPVYNGYSNFNPRYSGAAVAGKYSSEPHQANSAIGTTAASLQAKNASVTATGPAVSGSTRSTSQTPKQFVNLRSGTSQSALPSSSHSRKGLYSAAVNGEIMHNNYRNNSPPSKSKIQPPASADAFQPSFQHVIDNAKQQKPGSRRISGNTAQERQKIKKPTMNQKDAKDLAEKLAVEFFESTTQDFVKVSSRVEEARLPKKYMKTLVELFFEKSLGSNDDKRSSTCLVLKRLADDMTVTHDDLLEGLQSLFAKLGSRESDNPRIKSITASLLARVVINDLLTLKDVAEELKGGYYFPLFLLTLQQIVKITSKDELSKLFAESKVKMLAMMPEVSQEKQAMLEILRGKQLAFLLPLLHMETQLRCQLAENCLPTVVYRWIKENVSSTLHSDAGFITCLMTCCLHHVTKDSSLAEGVDMTVNVSREIQEKEKHKLAEIKPVLQKFVHDQPVLQLHALYAVQVFCHTNGFPKGLMLRMFNLLYNEDVIDEETYLAWKEDVNDNYPGKGKSLFQVNAWLTWLQEADTEDDEEEI